jgi:glycosyltransferase involved in cell wall biosynthesis
MMVSICVATYKRPEGLRKLLNGLNGLTFNKIERPTLEVIVVDNEASGRGLEICQALAPDFQGSLRCFEEPRQGITYARNKGLDNINPATDFVAFIDDDEVPDAAWLETLLTVQHEYKADVVSGRVIHRFEAEEIPDWITQLGCFDTPDYPDGHPAEEVFTCNVLVKAQIFRDLGRAFDHKFALTGGEDVDFFMRVAKAGYKMVWASQAITYEWVPNNRLSLRWNLLRGYRSWGSYSYCEKILYPSFKVRIVRLAKATTLVFIGLISLPFSVFLGQTQLVKSLLFIYRGLGSFSGLLDKQYQEYAEVEASS